MRAKNFAFYGKQAVIYSNGVIPQTPVELLDSGLFTELFKRYMDRLRKKDSVLLSVFPKKMGKSEQNEVMYDLLHKLAIWQKDYITDKYPETAPMFKDVYLLNEFMENLYNYWRSFERFFICYSVNGMEASFDKKPYRTFNHTVEILNHLARQVYRDICENITGDHPRIYRQVAAGCHTGVIATEKNWPCPAEYKKLKDVVMIRQVYISPPLILDPPMNKREGYFRKIDSNPLRGINLSNRDWLCYPAKVGDTLIHIFFHANFMGLGTSLANLFDLADDEDIKRKPDAIYAYGIPMEKLKKFGSPPTVFYEDRKNGMFVGAVPGTDDFGYFGYLKKMVLTLHNSAAIKKGRLPVHGAMVRINMKNGKSANVLIWGDTGTGKSETLEAFRVLGSKYIRDMIVIFDDMGTLDISDGKIVAYGTETGAFVRLDDLQPGFALGNMDRAIIHSPQKINARALLPITTQEEVTRGHEIDFILYANNYEKIDSDHKILEKIPTPDKALDIFREGARMAKGTTAETGLVYSFFANPFGPLQYKDEYEKLAQKYFRKVFDKKIFVGQMRTRLGIPGFETEGPQEAAKELFGQISKK